MTPEQFVTVARCVSMPMLLVSSDGQVIAANPAAATMLQRPTGEVVGKALASFVRDSEESIVALLRTFSRSRELSPGRLTIAPQAVAIDCLFEGCLIEPRLNGRPALLLVRFRSKSEARQSFAMLNQKIDELTTEITRRKRLEHERSALLASEKEARLAAERANRAKDEFLAVVSHELRAPLNVIRGWVDLLVSGDVEAAEIKDTYSILQRNCAHQVRLIEDLLDTSRVITGNLKLNVVPIELSSVVGEASEAIRTAAEAKGVELFVSSALTVGAISGDPDRLRQVVWNLLTNALKFSPKAGRIFVSIRRVNSKVELNITDEGEGIEPDFLPHVFEQFRQEDNSKTRPHGGLGLGLAIVRHIVELHGGTVAVTSAGKGKGATFTVALPLLAINIGTRFDNQSRLEASASTSQSDAAQRARSELLSGMRILVVDDEPDARALISRILRMQGAEVVTASSVKDALEHFQTGGFGLIVSDIGMPEETGYDLIRKIRLFERDNGKWTPAAAVTGFASSSDRELALQAGFHEHLTKPVDAHRLVNVAASLGHRRG